MTAPRRPLFELLLLAFPQSFRHRFGDAMRDAFDAVCLEHRGHPLRLLAFRLRTFADMAAAGVRERLRPSHHPRASRSDGWAGARLSSQDARLGLRMLAKHPGLTLVTVFALAIGIPVGLAPTHLANALEAPLPVPEGGRILLLRYWNPVTSRPEPTTLDDLRRWRDVMTTFGTLGAARRASYNVGTGDQLAPPVRGAEVTASAFDILRVPPLLGRTLGAADETPGAPLVAVIGYDLWQSRLAGDPRTVGRQVRIGGVAHTVVGVMPRAFRFPVNQQLWLPLRHGGSAGAGGSRPLVVFGRLAEGAAAAAAQAQLAALGHRVALDVPEERAGLVPEVVPYSYWSATVMGGPQGGIKATPEYYLSQALTLALLLVACVNVGMLIFARTAARSEELAVRTALGASRARIVSQIFTESLVLAGLSAGIGLVLIDRLPAFLIGLATQGQMPFWIDLGVGRETVVWTLGLAVASAAVVGIVPALRVTGRSIQWNIQHARAGRSGFGFGTASSALIVADVAIAVATVGLAAGMSYQLGETRDGRVATGIEAAQVLAAELGFPPTDRKDLRAAHAERRRALVARLESEPGVRGVAVASALPRMDHPVRTIEVERGAPADGTESRRVRVASVAPDFFATLGRPVLSGRGFDATDLRRGSTAVIVNTTFVATVLGGRNPIGTRLRFTGTSGDGRPGPWHEVVGVVGPLGMHVLNPERDEGVYLPLEPGTTPVHLAIHVAGTDPEAFAPRLRALAGEVDPTMSIGVPIALDKVLESDWYLMAGMALGGGALVFLLLALAASGIYAIMSFAVAARTRELGIRAALGASRTGIVLTVARRAVAQIALGALLGTPVAVRIAFELLRDAGGGASSAAVIAVALAPGLVVMLVVSLIACTAPTLRALRVTPAEALRVP